MPPPPVNPDDLLGATCDALTVRAVGKHIGTEWTYHCDCRCGNTVTVRRGVLLKHRRENSPLSCGCGRARAIQDYKEHALMHAHAHQRFYHRRTTAWKEETPPCLTP